METISTSRKERKRLEAFSRGKSRDLTLAAASGLLGLSYRQPKQASARYRARGTLDWCIARVAGHRIGSLKTKSSSGRWNCIASSMPIMVPSSRRNAGRKKIA